MIKVERFVNQLMTSNCYIVVNIETKKCIIIDPGSEKSEKEIQYINHYSLQPDYIIITHEHTDHNWGVNALRSLYPSVKIVCSNECNNRLNRSNRMYFLYYYDNPDYRYVIETPDIIIKDENESLNWSNFLLRFYFTPGHSKGGMCISIENMIFTGDTIMPYKPYFNGRDSNQDDWIASITKIKSLFSDDTIICPGHGDVLTFGEWKTNDEFVLNNLF